MSDEHISTFGVLGEERFEFPDRDYQSANLYPDLLADESLGDGSTLFPACITRSVKPYPQKVWSTVSIRTSWMSALNSVEPTVTIRVWELILAPWSKQVRCLFVPESPCSTFEPRLHCSPFFTDNQSKS